MYSGSDLRNGGRPGAWVPEKWSGRGYVMRTQQAITAGPRVAKGAVLGLGDANGLVISGTNDTPEPALPTASMDLRHTERVLVGNATKLALRWLRQARVSKVV